MKVYEALVRFKYAGAEESFRKVESIFPKDESYKLELLDVNSSRILLRFCVDGWMTTFEVVPDFIYKHQVNHVSYSSRYYDPEKVETMVDQVYGLMELEVNESGELLEVNESGELLEPESSQNSNWSN